MKKGILVCGYTMNADEERIPSVLVAYPSISSLNTIEDGRFEVTCDDDVMTILQGVYSVTHVEEAEVIAPPNRHG